MTVIPPNRGRGILRIVYIANLVLVGIVLFIVLFYAVSECINPSSSEVQYRHRNGLLGFLFYAVLSWPIFVIFLFLNIWMGMLEKTRRKRYLIISICLAAFLALTLPPVIEWYFTGAPMP